MKLDERRSARAMLAPKAIILGASTFQFGWALSKFMLPSEDSYSGDREPFLFLSFTLLAASACLTTNGTWGRFWAAFLCGPMPLVQTFVFWACARRADVPFFSIKHIGVWLEEMANAGASIWMLTLVSFAILTSAVAYTLRPPSRQETIRRS